jgi:acetyl-CoA C-acetyltransferase
MSERCAVIGIGQTKHDTERADVSIPGLVREAALRALEDAGLGFDDIDAVVVGKAPDMFEGMMMPELYLADALGAAGKPLLRVHTAGSVGGSTAVVAASLVQAGIHDRVLTVAFEKQSESNAMWALAPKIPFQMPLVAGAGGYFAPHIREYIRRSNAPDHIGIKVAVKDRLNALKNPYAHLHLPDISTEQVADSPMLWNPIRFLEACPSSDGACAMVLSSERAATGTPAWVHGTAVRSEPIGMAGRDEVNPRAGQDCARDLYAQAGITDPRRELDIAEIYVPFSWFEPMWLENLFFADEGSGWKLVDDGSTDIGGDIPIDPSGGVLSSNPIGASGMLRFAEAALQVRMVAAASSSRCGSSRGTSRSGASMLAISLEKLGALAIVIVAMVLVTVLMFGMTNWLEGALKRRGLPRWHAWFGLYALLEILLIAPKDRGRS